jgi:hypothetical protein
VAITTPEASVTTVFLIEKLPGSSDHWFPAGVVSTRAEAIRYVDRKNCGSSLSGDFYKYTEFDLETV